MVDTTNSIVVAIIREKGIHMNKQRLLWVDAMRHVVLGAALVTLATPAMAVDWNAAKGKDIVLFYPGQSSWEWALTKSDHSGATKFREGKKCRECHRGEEAKIGALIVSGRKLEPNPIPGKRGSINVNVKTAHDGNRLYVRLAWDAGKPGAGAKMDPKFENMVTVMIDDGHLVEATRAGCWGVCHDDAIGMASAVPGRKLTKYLSRSRTKLTRKGGGDSYKSKAQLDQLVSKGEFLEYWQARLNRGAAAVPVDGYILEKRHVSEKPDVSAEARFENGKWVAVLSRRLKPGQSGRKDIVPGTVYTIGFAIHDDYADHRFHHVSLGYTLALDQGNADFIAASR